MKNKIICKIPKSNFGSLLDESNQEEVCKYKIGKINKKAKPFEDLLKVCCKAQQCEIVMIKEKTSAAYVGIEFEVKADLIDSAESIGQKLKDSIRQKCSLAAELNEILLCGNHEAVLLFKKDLPSQHNYQCIEKVMTTLSKLPEDKTTLLHGKEEISLQRLVRVSTMINVRVEKTCTVPIGDISFRKSLLNFAIGTKEYELSCYPNQLDNIHHYLGKTTNQILKIKLIELRIKGNEVYGELVKISVPY